MQYNVHYRFYWRLNGKTRNMHGVKTVWARTEDEAKALTLRTKLNFGDKNNIFFIFNNVRPIWSRVRVE